MHKSYHIVVDTTENVGIENVIKKETKTRFQATRNRDKEQFFKNEKIKKLYDDTCIFPSKFSLCAKREQTYLEKNLMKTAAEEFIPAKFSEMYCVDDYIKLLLHAHTDEQSATQNYLRIRYEITPKCRFTSQVLTSMDYGWIKCCEENFCGPKFGKKNHYEKWTLTDNHIPQLNFDGSFRQNIM